ncbi:MAG: hypothetical protein ACK4GD_00805 [Sphingomonadaceae bacterium]
MTEERIETHRDTDGTTHTTTVIREAEAPKRGAGPWLVIAVIVALAVAALVVFSQYGQSEIAKDAAIAEAANEVGAAAQQVGEAAQEAADQMTN